MHKLGLTCDATVAPLELLRVACIELNSAAFKFNIALED